MNYLTLKIKLFSIALLMSGAIFSEELGRVAVWSYPPNTLVAGDGSLVVEAVMVKCLDEDELEVPKSECSLKVPPSPITYLSPYGERDRVVNNVKFYEFASEGSDLWELSNIDCLDENTTKAGFTCVEDELEVFLPIYPENELEVGDGVVEFYPIDMEGCLNITKGSISIDKALCSHLLLALPKIEYKSPSGEREVSFENYLRIADVNKPPLETLTYPILFEEGESYLDLSLREKSDRLPTDDIDCATGYSLALRWCTNSMYYFRYLNEQESPTSYEVCSGTELLYIKRECVERITNSVVNNNFCPSEERAGNYLIHESPEGTRTVQIGEVTVTQKCEVGKEVWVTVPEVTIDVNKLFIEESNSELELTNGLNQATGEIIPNSGWGERFTTANDADCGDFSSEGYITLDSIVTKTSAKYTSTSGVCSSVTIPEDPDRTIVWSDEGIVQESIFQTEDLLCNLNNDCGVTKNINYENKESGTINPTDGENATKAGSVSITTYNYQSSSVSSRNGTRGVGGIADLLNIEPTTRYCVMIRDASTDGKTSSFARNPSLNYRVYNWTPIRQGSHAKDGNKNSGSFKTTIIKGMDSSMRYWSGRSGVFDD